MHLHRWSTLFEDPLPSASPSSGAGAGPRRLKPGVQATAWQLVRLANELRDEGLGALAGRLLAARGPADPTSIAFHVGDSSTLGRVTALPVLSYGT